MGGAAAEAGVGGAGLMRTFPVPLLSGEGGERGHLPEAYGCWSLWADVVVRGGGAGFTDPSQASRAWQTWARWLHG